MDYVHTYTSNLTPLTFMQKHLIFLGGKQQENVCDHTNVKTK